MKINVVWSTDEESNKAGKNCAKKAVLDLIQTKLAIMFSSEKYNQEELLIGAKSILGTAPIIGCTTSEGIVVSEGYINPENSLYAGMMAIGDRETEVVTSISIKINSARETGILVAKRAMNKIGTKLSPSYFFMIANTEDEEEYAEGIREVIGNVPMFGCGPTQKNMKIYTEEGIVANGVAVAFVYTNKKIENIFDNNYHETINSGVITKITGNNIDEINGIKALKKYCEWTDKKVRDIKENKIFEESILKPLGIKTSDGNSIIIKQPLIGNDDYSIKVSNKIYTNTAIIQMQISKQELINAPTHTLRKLKNNIKIRNSIQSDVNFEESEKAYLIFQNYARKKVIGQDIDKMVEKLKKEVGDIPFLMTFTDSESSSKYFARLMLSEIAFCDI